MVEAVADLVVDANPPATPQALPQVTVQTLADGRVRFVLPAPVLHHDKPVTSFNLRPPSIDEQLTHGDPVSWVAGGGSATRVIDRDLLRRFFGLLIEGHDADMIGRVTDPRLGYLIEEALLGFFAKARTESAPTSKA